MSRYKGTWDEKLLEELLSDDEDEANEADGEDEGDKEDEGDEEDQEGRKWGEDQYIGPPPKLDDLLRTMSKVMGFDHPERPTCETDMCYTLHLVGLVEVEVEDGVSSYTATPELIRLAKRSKHFKELLKEEDEMGGLRNAGFPKIARLLLGTK